ncbi:MAG: tRNA 2-selenouridine(34) synthase MnmH [Alphaproteobacteria bacterium]|nr:tRNA 2-selenouridine(34) synthase MnmH [Alphaproteobacteria bacterium]
MRMKFTMCKLSDLEKVSINALVDVRSPAEFADDHLPGATSMPVLSDEERARVGTIYKRESPFKARKIGAALIARNVAHHLETQLADMPHDWRPFVYCWRGGQRSGAFATILSEIGWRVSVLEGGYRAYRRKVVDFCHNDPIPHRLILLDGNTGTAKTEILGLLRERGHQVVDLEGLAAHRGSVFGAMTQGQPTQKRLEGGIAMAFAGLDPDRPVLIEAESSKIGDRHIPTTLWRAMQAAPRIELAAPAPERARYLVRTYRERVADPSGFERIIESLTPIQGRERVSHWIGLLRAGALEDLAAELIAHHYDPRYGKAREKGLNGQVAAVSIAGLDDRGLADAVPAIEAAVDRLTPDQRTMG